MFEANRQVVPYQPPIKPRTMGDNVLRVFAAIGIVISLLIILFVIFALLIPSAETPAAPPKAVAEKPMQPTILNNNADSVEAAADAAADRADQQASTLDPVDNADLAVFVNPMNTAGAQIALDPADDRAPAACTGNVWLINPNGAGTFYLTARDGLFAGDYTLTGTTLKMRNVAAYDNNKHKLGSMKDQDDAVSKLPNGRIQIGGGSYRVCSPDK